MLVVRRRWLLATLAAAAIAVLSCAAHAQDGVAAWRVECTGDGKILDCRAVQQLFQRIPNQGDRLLVALLVRRPADPKAPAQMTMQLPLGLNLTEPVQVKVDGGATERQPIQTCTNIGCFVSMADQRQVRRRHAQRQGPQGHRAGPRQEAGRDVAAAARLRPRLRPGQAVAPFASSSHELSIAGLDPAIQLLTQYDGCAGQARA